MQAQSPVRFGAVQVTLDFSHRPGAVRAIPEQDPPLIYTLTDESRALLPFREGVADTFNLAYAPVKHRPTELNLPFLMEYNIGVEPRRILSQARLAESSVKPLAHEILSQSNPQALEHLLGLGGLAESFQTRRVEYCKEVEGLVRKLFAQAYPKVTLEGEIASWSVQNILAVARNLSTFTKAVFSPEVAESGKIAA